MCLPSSVLRHDYSPATQNHSPPATCLPLQLYMRLVLLPLFVPCQPGKLILQNSVKMLPPGEKLHQLPWALSSLLFWGAAIKNHYTFTWHSSVYLSLHKGSHVHSSQNTRGCGNVCRVYARAWETVSQKLFVKLKGWMGGQINQQINGQFWKARKLFSLYVHMQLYKNELPLSYCLVTITNYFQTLF